MSLASRIGAGALARLRNIGPRFTEQFGEAGQQARWAAREAKGRAKFTNQFGARDFLDPYSIEDYAAITPLTNAAVGGTLGSITGLSGALAGEDDGMAGPGIGAAIGAGALGGAAALGGGAVIGKRLVVALARALMNKAPQMPEGAAIEAATKGMQRAVTDMNARAQVERILGTKIDWDRLG